MTATNRNIASLTPDSRIDNDGKIDSVEPNETLAIHSVAEDASKDLNLFFIGLGVKPLSTGDTPGAFAHPAFDAAWISPFRNGTLNYILAHEIGHLLGVGGQMTSNKYLMYEKDLTSSPCVIGKRDWDLANRNN